MTDTTDTIDRTRRVEYMKLKDIVRADRNPKLHDLEEMRDSIKRLEYIEPVMMDERTLKLVGGHGRLEFLLAAEADPSILADPDAPDVLVIPEGILVDDDGDWTVPVNRGWASKNDEDAEAAVITLNRLAEKAGWDEAELYAMLTSQTELVGIGYGENDVEQFAINIGEIARRETEFLNDFDEPEADPDAEPGEETDSYSHVSGTTKVEDQRVILEFPMTKDERTETIELLNRIKAHPDTKAETNGEALLEGLRTAAATLTSPAE